MLHREDVIYKLGFILKYIVVYANKEIKAFISDRWICLVRTLIVFYLFYSAANIEFALTCEESALLPVASQKMNEGQILNDWRASLACNQIDDVLHPI